MSEPSFNHNGSNRNQEEGYNFRQVDLDRGSSLDKASESSIVASPRLTGITVDKSVEFSYEELAMAKKIGQGGFGAVYYAELQDESKFTWPPEYKDMVQRNFEKKGFS